MLSEVPYIETYLGFASENRLVFICRLLNNTNPIPQPNDGIWKNLLNTWNRAATNEIGEAHVNIELGDLKVKATSDMEGYIFIDMNIKCNRAEEHMWKPVIISAKNNTFHGEVMIPSSQAEFGIISDIDDTVLVTEVNSKFRMMVNSLLKNPYQRATFRRIDTFYNDILRSDINPVFYISKSPWNLYNNIKQFLEINKMPKGPIILRDFGIHFPKAPRSYTDHKEIKIELILSVYRDLPFILIGDASQEDAIIYSLIKKKYPSRIKRIYIKEVADKTKMKTLMSNAEIQNSDITFFKNYKELIER